MPYLVVVYFLGVSVACALLLFDHRGAVLYYVMTLSVELICTEG